MNITATQIRVGNILNLEGELYRVTWTQHVTPGKGVACMQTKLKHIINGKNLEKRFRSADRVEKAHLEEKQMQYLYNDRQDYIFMDNETFDQTALPESLLEGAEKYLVEETVYPVQFHDEAPIGIDLPTHVQLRVTMAPPEVKKATATNSLRPVELENGMSVNAPAFIKEGDRIKLNTETGEYVERVK